MDEEALFGQLLEENKQAFINLDTGRANFTDNRFTGLLNAVRAYAEQGYISQYLSPQQSAAQRLQDDLTAVPGKRYFKFAISYDLVYPFIRNFPASMRMVDIEYFSDIINDEIAGIRANTDGSVPFLYLFGFCMNSQSKNKPAAWAFIKYLLSKEMQTSGVWGVGLGINNEARAEGAEFRLFGRRLEDAGTVLSKQQRQALEEYLEEYKAVL
jgi:ABC-type glycerol-3-phosphate transport system substrate-binding protein